MLTLKILIQLIKLDWKNWQLLNFILLLPIWLFIELPYYQRIKNILIDKFKVHCLKFFQKRNIMTAIDPTQSRPMKKSQLNRSTVWSPTPVRAHSVDFLDELNHFQRSNGDFDLNVSNTSLDLHKNKSLELVEPRSTR